MGKVSRTLFVLILSGAVICPVTAVAQQPTPDAQRSPLCGVAALSTGEGQPFELRANCRGQGILLGLATSYEASVNQALQATLVDIRLGSERRVLLLSIQPDGTSLVEDLGGQIALAAGRGPMSDLDGIELNTRAFAVTGEIGVRGRPEDVSPRNADRINLGQQVAAERSRRGITAQN